MRDSPQRIIEFRNVNLKKICMFMHCRISAHGLINACFQINLQVEFVLKHYRDLSPFLRKCKTLKLGPDFFIPQDIGDYNCIDQEMTNESPHSTIVDSDEQPMSYTYDHSSGSSGSENVSSSSMLCTEFVRKKRSGVVYVCGINNNIRSSSNNNNKLGSEEDIATSMSRRKGIPQRSPMC